MPFKISIRTTLILTAALAVIAAMVVCNPKTYTWETVGICVGGGGPFSYLDAYSDLVKSAETLQMTPVEKPAWAAEPQGKSNSWFTVNDGDATVWVRVSGHRHSLDAIVIGHKDCLPWQDVSAEQELTKKTTGKLDGWWQEWSIDHGWPER